MFDFSKLHKKLLEILDYIDHIAKENKIEYSLCAGSVLGAIRHKGFIPWDDDLDIMLQRNEYNKLIKCLSNENKIFLLQEDQIDYPLMFSKVRMKGTTFIEKGSLKSKWQKMNQGIYVDIFPMDYASKNNFKFILQILFSRILTAQSLYIRGYSNATLLKKGFMSISMIFYPFHECMFKYLTSVKLNEAKGICDFFAPGNQLKKIFPTDLLRCIKYVQFENIEAPIPSAYDLYLSMKYGNYMTPPEEDKKNKTIHCKYFSDIEDYTKFLEKTLGKDEL